MLNNQFHSLKKSDRLRDRKHRGKKKSRLIQIWIRELDRYIKELTGFIPQTRK